MRLIDELFKRYRYKEETLIPYGFIFSNNVYKYSKLIHDGAFSIELEINKGKIIGKLSIQILMMNITKSMSIPFPVVLYLH